MKSPRERQAADAPSVLEDDGDLSDISKVVVDLRGKQKAIKRARGLRKAALISTRTGVLESFFTGLHTKLVNAQTKLEAHA